MRILIHSAACLVALLAIAELAGPAAAQPADAAGGAASSAEPMRTAAATIDEHPIYVDEVDAALEKLFRGRPLDEQVRPRLAAQMLEQLIDQRLIARFLLRESQGVGQIEVDAAIKNLKEQLGGDPDAYAKFLQRERLTPERLRERLAWELGWPRYVQSKLTPERLESYFGDHAREFDGTQLKARQIVLAIKEPRSEDTVAAAQLQAEQIREQIVAGKLSFEDAARKYSIAPSRASGGDVGALPRHSSMPEAFSRALFALQAGEVSQPVVSPYGVHLIECTGVEPGDKTWRQASRALAEAITRELFDEVSGAERKSANIEYTGAMPHLEHGRLVAASAED